ncbi:MAG TPA: thiolase family protein [Solirubrobacterales bacterium]|nr:thiolase family protein [Solirubrobacterales bacterium]
MSGVHLLGVGSTSLSRRPRGSRHLAREAVAAALADAGVDAAEVDGVAIASADPGFDLGCYDVLGKAHRPYKCRCGLGAIALHSSWNAVAAGASDLVVCVGHDAAPAAAPVSIETQAAAAREYMQHSGATEEHLARVAAKNRRHGAANPHALLGVAAEPEEILASELLVWPLRRLMVAEPSMGAAAVVLGSHDAGRSRGPKAPRVRASVLLDEDSTGGAATARAARLGYFSAGVEPEEIDLAEIEDPTPVDELEAYEALEFAPPGSGPELVDSGFTALGGVVPVNPSGGALCQGQVTGAGAILPLVELSLQLRDRAGHRQVPGARVGLALSGSASTPGAVKSMTIVSI